MDEPKEPARPARPRASSQWVAPFLWFEWLMEWIVYCCSRIAFFKVLEYIGKLPIVTGVIFYILEAPERKQRAMSSAWLLVNSGNSGQGLAGRYEALQYLAQQGAPLEGVRIWISDLSGINFKSANLRKAYIVSSKMNNANLANADLTASDLQNTSFLGANLSGAILLDANLLCSNFRGSVGLRTEQIKKGKRWEEAIYDTSLRKSLGLPEVPLPKPQGSYECSS